ncbi:MAG: dockerin type I repeat-containing protein [Muribaculaceae bacterium]|nr:dockerin type I repeat-containing protein [Muribaculaceae bacterium]
MKKALLLLFAALLGMGAWAQVTKDNKSYEPYGEIKVKNLWINAENYSNRTQFQAQPFMQLSNNTKQPMAVMYDGIIYVAHSEAKTTVVSPGDTVSQAVVHRFDVLTGAALSDLDLTLDGRPYGGLLAANNIGVDNFGHLWIMPYRQIKDNTMLYQLNPDNGEMTLLATLESDIEIARIDYYDVVGDITLQEAPCNIIAPGASVEAVYGWHNDIDGDADTWTGFFDGDTYMNFTEFYPAKQTNWGIAPYARFLLGDDEDTRYDGDLFYIDGFNQYPTLYARDGSIIDSFEFATESLKADSVLYPLTSVNGVADFFVGDCHMFAYAKGDYNAPNTYDIIVAELGEGAAFDGMTRCWQMPSRGLGNNNESGRRLTVINTEEIEVGGKPAVRMMIYKNANGIAVYEIGEGVEGGGPSFDQGDVNGDGVVSGADVTALYNVLLDGAEAGGDPDVNQDGVVSGADVTALYNILLNS